jgi:hypothetical protein
MLLSSVADLSSHLQYRGQLIYYTCSVCQVLMSNVVLMANVVTHASPEYSCCCVASFLPKLMCDLIYDAKPRHPLQTFTSPS